MPKDFVQLKASLRSWLGGLDEDELPDAVASDIINVVQRETLRIYDLSFGEVQDVFQTIPEMRDYPYADLFARPFSRPFSLWYSDPATGDVVTLKQKDKGAFDDLVPGSGIYGIPAPMGAGTYGQNTSILGDPTIFTLWGGYIQLGKVPTTILTIFVNYYGLQVDLTDNEPENSFTKGAWEYLLFKSLVKASEFGFETEQTPTWEREATKMEQQLVIEYGRSQTMGINPQSDEPG